MRTAGFQIEKSKPYDNPTKVLKLQAFAPVLIERPRCILRWTHQPFPPKLSNNTLGEIGDGAQKQLLCNKK